MQINVSVKNGRTVLSLYGRLDATQAPDFAAAVQQAIREGASRLVLDCSGLSYVASMGLRCFLVAHKAAAAAGGGAVFCGFSPNVRAVLTLSGFEKLVTVKDSLGEALKAGPPSGAGA